MCTAHNYTAGITRRINFSACFLSPSRSVTLPPPTFWGPGLYGLGRDRRDDGFPTAAVKLRPDLTDDVYGSESSLL